MICRVSLFVLILHYSSMVFAEENETADDTSTIEFIEFLGDWETADGEWIDPNELAAEDGEGPRPDPQRDTSGEGDQ